MTNYKHHMDNTQVEAGPDTFSVRKTGNEASIAVKAVEYSGGIEGIARRLIAVWLDMPEHYRTVGLHWYDIASEFAQDLATVYGLTLWQTSQVISVLSPQNPWNGKINKDGVQFRDGNRLCSLNVIKAWFEGGESSVMALHGWGYASPFLDKAVKVLRSEELDWTGALKTHRFALLIADPTRTDIVVIDSHASRIATGNLGDRYHVVAKSAYPSLESAYLLAASTLGIPAYVLQAGTWQFATEGYLY